MGTHWEEGEGLPGVAGAPAVSSQDQMRCAAEGFVGAVTSSEYGLDKVYRRCCMCTMESRHMLRSAGVCWVHTNRSLSVLNALGY